MIISANIGHLLVLGVISLAVTLLMVPVVKRIAFRLNAIDYPGARRVNTIPVARMGGVAMFVGVIGALVFEVFAEHLLNWHGFERSSWVLAVNYKGVLVGLAVTMLVGAVDDVKSLKPSTKLLGQIVGASIIAASGVLLSSINNPLGAGYVEFGWLSYPLTVFYLVAFMNVINLVDGLDGLAAGIVGIAALTLFFIGMGKLRLEVAMFAVVLLGACLGFLRYNFNPASIFMGDSGSLFLGAMLGVISLLGVIRSSTLVVMVATIVIAAIPIADTLVAIIRRVHNHQPIQQADAKHLHHKLLREGYSVRKSVLIVYGWTAMLAFGAFVISNLSGIKALIVFVVLAAASFAILLRLGIFEPVLRHHYNRRRGPIVHHHDDEEAGADASGESDASVEAGESDASDGADESGAADTADGAGGPDAPDGTCAADAADRSGKADELA